MDFEEYLQEYVLEQKKQPFREWMLNASPFAIYETIMDAHKAWNDAETVIMVTTTVEFARLLRRYAHNYKCVIQKLQFFDSHAQVTVKGQAENLEKLNTKCCEEEIV